MWQSLFSVKTVGCILILLSALCFGAAAVKRLRFRPMALRDLADGLSVVERVSCSQLLPLPEAFRAAAQSAGHASALFQAMYVGLDADLSLPELWTGSVRALRYLNAQERQTAISLKNSLGCPNVRIQQSELENCIIYLRAHAEGALQSAASGIRLSFGLSVVGGLMLVVLLY